MAKYSEQQIMGWFERWRSEGRNLSAINEDPDTPSYPTLLKYKREGHPKSVMDGLNWDQYADKLDRAKLDRERTKSIEAASKDDRNFMENQKSRLMQMMDQVFHKVMADQTEVSINDFNRMMDLYIKLDNQAADRIEWMRKKMRLMVKVVRRHVNDEQFEGIKMDLMDEEAKAIEQHGDIPNKEKLLS